MKTLDHLMSRDLFQLALVISLLRLDVPYSLIPESGDNLFPMRDNYDENLIRHKEVLDDLCDLGRSVRWLDQQRPLQPVEISAYVLDRFDESQSSEVEEEIPLSRRSVSEDSGVSDVESASGSRGRRSPSSNSESSTNFELNDEELQLAVGDLDPVEDRIPDIPLNLPESLHPEDPFFPLDSELMNLDDAAVFSDYLGNGLDSDPTLPTFAPDEEDVENQLMHIDDQLIRLDGNIDNINEGFHSLDQALVAAEDQEMLDDDENSMLEALLGQKDEEFLFSSLQSNHSDQVAGSTLQTWQQEVIEPLQDLVEDFVLDQPSKVEVKEDVDSEPEKEVQVKKEPVEDVKEEFVDGAVASNFYSEEQDLKVGIKLEEFVPLPHLLDHSYAASPFDGGFGNSVKEEDFSRDDEGCQAEASPFFPPDYFHLSDGASPSPSSSSLSSIHKESRDERKAREHGLPFTCSEIIDSPMDKFNDLLASASLTEAQQNLCRDIRRRGKNKVAAQNCRRRKLDLINHLTDEVQRAKEYKQKLLAEREQLYKMRNEWTSKLLHLEEQILMGLDRSPDEYSLELVPHTQQFRVAQRSRTRAEPSTSASTTTRLAKPTRA